MTRVLWNWLCRLAFGLAFALAPAVHAQPNANANASASAGTGTGTGTGAGALACPPPLPAAPDSTAPRDRGVLWRISRDGRSSWLYGTLHVGRPAWQRLGPQTAQALSASDVLALEIDPSDPALLLALAALPALPLPGALRQRLAQAGVRACLAPDLLATLHPVLQVTTLVLLEARWFGMAPLHAQEQLLAARARGAGLAVVALETAAQQIAALLPDDPAVLQQRIEQTLAQLEDGSGRRVLQRMVQAWERGDLAALQNVEGWCACVASDGDRAQLRQLNDDRNPALADGIDARHRAGLRVFAAVGALHMTGAQALPVLLAARGFHVERIVWR